MLAIATLSLGSVGLVLGDSDDDDDEHDEHKGWLKPRADVAPVVNPTYSEECGGYHMA